MFAELPNISKEACAYNVFAIIIVNKIIEKALLKLWQRQPNIMDIVCRNKIIIKRITCEISSVNSYKSYYQLFEFIK